MSHLNIEVKAKCLNQEGIREILRLKNAVFKGTDYQVDTYFKVNHGRLKLREGNIENALIYYDREDIKGSKRSEYIVYHSTPNSSLKEILTKALDRLVIVDKEREIYFIENIKFHIDTVKNLGTFIEIEAVDSNGSIGEAKLREQCQFFLDLFHIPVEDLITFSYSDL